MGKHNGKARRTGLSVGKTLENAARKNKVHQTPEAKPTVQSVLEQDGVTDLLALATLAGKEFAAERQKVIVLDSHVAVHQSERSTTEEAEVLEQYRQLVKIPRRPRWTSDQRPEQLDRQEKDSFLEWRRGLALMHERAPEILLTPFEKNLEVWRQLWRVLERSSILVQVVDARNPLLYFSEDLVAYAKELDATTESIVLLNKADLVAKEMRKQWSDYFSSKGVLHAFWSAKKANDEDEASTSADDADTVTQLFGVAEVISLLENLSDRLQKDKKKRDINGEEPSSRTVVGLVGYPNVGKSSTINALYGRKKTPVAATPGRTKHFQTLNISETLCLCDCPGLVLPALARSKAELVAAGVIPVDSLVDVVAPVSYILSKIGYDQFSSVYGLPTQGIDEKKPNENRTIEAMASLALSRGWTQAAGRPDQTKTGRYIIKDFLSGRLSHCEAPPGCTQPSPDPSTVWSPTEAEKEQTPSEDVQPDFADDTFMEEFVEDDDLGEEKPRRAQHKFQKKPPRRKGNRGRQYNQSEPATSDVRIKGNRGSLINRSLGSSY